MHKVYIGTSGFTLQEFYPTNLPTAEKLAYYSARFPTVEINSSFYHFPRQSTVEKWLSVVPPQFVFTLKVNAQITHSDDHQLQLDLLAEWFDHISPLATEQAQHQLLFQFRSSFSYDKKQLIALLIQLPRTFLYAFEFRHSSWINDEVTQLLGDQNIAFVLSDSPIKKNGQPQ